MPKAKFVLKEPKQSEETLIYLFYRFGGNILKYSTGQKIKPKYWNPANQRAKLTRVFPSAEVLNELLENLSRRAEDAHKELINQNVKPTVFKLKMELDKVLFKEEAPNPKGFIKFIDDLITNSNRKDNTKRQWKQTLRKLKEFQHSGKAEVEFDSINLEFYEKYVHFLTKEGYTTNSIGGFIKNVKIFMNEAVERKLTNNLEYRNRRFKVLEEQVEKIYLTKDDIKSIYQLDLSENSRLEKVRDLFIIACYTGLRFSDLIQVRKENIINNGSQIRIKTEKTAELVIIPIHTFIKKILSKYNGDLPSVISNQKMNQYLKEISVLAGLDEEIKIGITRGGKLQNEIFKKSQLVSTHTARRSFATNAYLMEVPTISIMKITGHRTEKSFMKYIRISQQENADKIASHPFFI